MHRWINASSWITASVCVTATDRTRAKEFNSLVSPIHLHTDHWADEHATVHVFILIPFGVAPLPRPGWVVCQVQLLNILFICAGTQTIKQQEKESQYIFYSGPLAVLIIMTDFLIQRQICSISRSLSL